MPCRSPHRNGLIISYAYLLHHERLAGQDEGRKDRPAVVVLVARQQGDAIEVTVLPITHRAPDNADWAIEIPPPVKWHLGLDDARSWIVVAESNGCARWTFQKSWLLQHAWEFRAEVFA